MCGVGVRLMTTPSAPAPAKGGRRLFSTCLLLAGLAALALALTPSAEASHFRYGTLNWHHAGLLGLPLYDPLTVEFGGESYWRIDSLGGACTGPLCPLDGCLDFGDGTSTPVSVRIGTTNVVDSYYGGAIVDSQGNPIRHTYPAQGVYVAQLTWCGSSLRVNTIPPTYRHVNNPDGQWSVNTMIDLTGGAPKASPITSMPVFVECVHGTICEFDVPAADPIPSGALQWRLATSAEAGAGGPFAQPGGCIAGAPCVPSSAATIHPSTGRYSWNTVGAYVDPGVCQSLYSTQVVVEPGAFSFESTAVDFFIRLHHALPPPAPTLYAGPVTYVPPLASVTLSWPPGVSSSPCPVTHYNVYRSIVSGVYGSVPLASVPDPVTTHTDSTLEPCRTYYYVARAVNVAGEGPSSNEATVTTDPTGGSGACSLPCPSGTTGPNVPYCDLGAVPCPLGVGTPPGCECPPGAGGPYPLCVGMGCPPPTSGNAAPECCPPGSGEPWPQCYGLGLTPCGDGEIGVEPVCLHVEVAPCEVGEVGVEPACVEPCLPPALFIDEATCLDEICADGTIERCVEDARTLLNRILPDWIDP